jgi:flagellar capping protein FliD
MLEARLAEFISKFDTMASEMAEIKKQQSELIEFIKKNFTK